jgi:hypothetical protein
VINVNIEFFDGGPNAGLGGRIPSVLAGAQRIDAAVAFVTRRGADLVRQLMALPGLPVIRLVASVRFPTNLSQLAELAGKLPRRVWIHLGYNQPQEALGDRGQFHSKLAMADLEGG